MKYLANILTQDKFEDNSYYNVVDDVNMLVPGIPTLIIGEGLAKTVLGDSFKVLPPHGDIANGIYWTYKKRSKRDEYENDLAKFKAYSLNNAIKNANYMFFNVLTASHDEKVNMNVFLSDSSMKYALISDDMLYVYCPDKEFTVGISLSDIEYSGMNRDKILRLVKINKSTKIVNERDFISYETHGFIKNNKYIIPYLASLCH